MAKTAKRKYKILMYSIILIIFFEPQIFKEPSFVNVYIVDYIYKILKLSSFFIISICYIKNSNYKVSKLLLKILLLQVIMLISTVIYHGDLVRFMGPALTTITMCMIAELLLKEKIFFKTIKIVSKYFLVCFILNFISIILIDFTDFSKITRVYFMGIDNRFIFTLVPWILFEGLISIKEQAHLNKRWMFIFIASEAILIYKFSVAAMIIYMLYVLLLIDGPHFEKYYGFTFWTYITTNMAIIFLNIQKLFSPLLLLVKKDYTLSGRVYIWNGILKNFAKYPIIGQGMQSTEYDKSFFYNSSAPYYLPWCKVVHAHNSLMTLLYRGGILSVLVYLTIVYSSLKQLSINYLNKYAKILAITLVIILIASIFDTMDFAGLYFIISLAINIKELDKAC